VGAENSKAVGTHLLQKATTWFNEVTVEISEPFVGHFWGRVEALSRDHTCLVRSNYFPTIYLSLPLHGTCVHRILRDKISKNLLQK